MDSLDLEQFRYELWKLIDHTRGYERPESWYENTWPRVRHSWEETMEPFVKAAFPTDYTPPRSEADKAVANLKSAVRLGDRNLIVVAAKEVVDTHTEV